MRILYKINKCDLNKKINYSDKNLIMFFETFVKYEVFFYVLNQIKHLVHLPRRLKIFVLSLDSPVPTRWLHLQKLILPLFENVCEESSDPVIQRLAKDFTFDVLDGEYLVNLKFFL